MEPHHYIEREEVPSQLYALFQKASVEVTVCLPRKWKEKFEGKECLNCFDLTTSRSPIMINHVENEELEEISIRNDKNFFFPKK